jgi:Fe-S oxidoreductase
MSLKQLERDMAGCSRCSNCKWIPHGQIKSWRFAYGCPSISKYNFHAYSGGGKMIIGLSSLLDRTKLTDKTAGITYNCQLCGLCQVSCQAYRDDIDLCDVLLELRATFVQEGFLLPEHLDMIESMKKEDNSMGMAKADRGNWADDLGIADINKEKVDVLFHAGCRYSYDEDLRSSVRDSVMLLKKAGVKVGIAGKDESCCGGRAYEIGYQGELKNFAEDMKGRVKASGAKIMVTPCSDCYYTFKYLYEKNGISLGAEICHMSELVSRLIQAERINPKNAVPMRVTYHDPCHLGRRGEVYKTGWTGRDKLERPIKYKQTGRLGIFDPPRDIIKSIPGVDFVEMERIREYSWCCGSGGGVLEANPEFASWTARERLQEALSKKAEAIVTACPWCVRVFKDAIKETGDKIMVYDVIELLNISMGGR